MRLRYYLKVKRLLKRKARKGERGHVVLWVPAYFRNNPILFKNQMDAYLKTKTNLNIRTDLFMYGYQLVVSVNKYPYPQPCGGSRGKYIAKGDWIRTKTLQ